MGIEARAGIHHLWRQRMSKRSSPKPRKAIVWREMMAERYDASWCGLVSAEYYAYKSRRPA